jgi:hypothetical protein
VARDYHQEQVELYCKYRKDKLLGFLQKATAYSLHDAQIVCHNYKLFKEEAYLLIKTGREDEAVRVLIRYCESVTEAVEFALALNLSDMQSMWDMMLASSTDNTDRLN